MSKQTLTLHARVSRGEISEMQTCRIRFFIYEITSKSWVLPKGPISAVHDTNARFLWAPCTQADC